MYTEEVALARNRASRTTEWPKEPYKGLNFFTSRDRPLFSQRNEEIEDCAASIDDFATRVLILQGSSGTGKSSFLRAGLVPRLELPPEEGSCRFFFLRDDAGMGEPILIRATDDPVAQIYRALTTVARADRRIPTAARNRMLTAINGELPRDRRVAAERILLALTALTASLRDIFVLMVDQAEEVLTLPPDGDAENRRKAFFYFLEGICFSRIDMRALVALRTEYYGRFCSFFHIRPSISLSAAAQTRAGLVDFLLRGLRDPDRIAAAIRWPTLREPLNGLTASFDAYGFEYAAGVPERIAEDLVRAVGDASTLPVMQIVCKGMYESVVLKGQRCVITMADYEDIGGVDGALDGYIESAVRGTLHDAGQSSVCDVDLDRWRLVLASLVGRQEGGAITTLIAAENRLVELARQGGVTGDAAAALAAMAGKKWRLLRAVSGRGAENRAYSLGHDSVAMVLCRWRENHAERQAAAERLERERREAAERLDRERSEAQDQLNRQRRMSRRRLLVVGVVAGGIGLFASIGFVEQTYIARAQTVKALNQAGRIELTGDFRLRLLLLAASLRQSEGPVWSWVIPPIDARKELKALLFRSPVFGGNFPAGVNANGDRLIRLQAGEVIARDLRTAKDDDKPIGSIPVADPEFGSPKVGRPPTIGLVHLGGSGAERDEVPVIYQDGERLVTSWINGVMRSVPVVWKGVADEDAATPEHILLPESFAATASRPPIPEIAGGTLRFVTLGTNPAGNVDRMAAVQLRAEAEPAGVKFAPVELPNDVLNWKPGDRVLWRVPVLSEGCDDLYAYLGAEPDGRPLAWLGQLGKSPWLQSHRLDTVVSRTDPVPWSLAVARGCEVLVVREGSDRLQLLTLAPHSDALFGEKTISVGIPRDAKGFRPTPFPQMAPVIAAAPAVDERGSKIWRVAWLVDNGLAVVDIDGEGNTDPKLHGSAVYLAGLDGVAARPRLTFSLDGAFLILAQQSWVAEPRVRVFDLRLEQRRQEIERLGQDLNALREEACRVAEFQTGSNALTKQELIAYLRNPEAPQPCANL
jgi:hypothetical protein